VGDETGLLHIGIGMEEKVILTPLFQKSGTKNIFKEAWLFFKLLNNLKLWDHFLLPFFFEKAVFIPP
jgi:hypothetical protein